MRKAKNSRSKLRKKEIEQLLEEMTSKLNSVIAEKQEGEQLLAEITLKLDNVTAELERSRLEKNADKTRQNIEALSKACISALEKMKATGSHWKIPANIFDKINHLENDIENKTTYLLSNLDQLRSWSGDVNISALSINASTIEKEAVAFFSNVRVEIENIEEELLHFIVEDEKLIFEEISQDMRDTVVELSKQLLELCDSMEEAAKSVKADKKIFHEIEEIRSLINTKESFLIQETFALKTVPEKSGANKQSKLEEVHRVDKEIKDSLEEAVGKIKLVKDKLQILSDAKKRRQKKVFSTLSLTSILFVWGTQLLLAVLSKKIAFDTLQFTAWLIVSTLSATLFTFLYFFYSNLVTYYSKQIEKRKGLLVSLLFYVIIMILYWLLLSYVTFALLSNWLFIVVFPAYKILSGSNATSIFIQNFVAIVAIISLLLYCFRAIKQQADKMFE